MKRRPRSVHIVTFGCQMNKLDSELLSAELLARGYRMEPDPHLADVVLFNTCSVRAHAEDRVFSHLGAYRRRAERDGQFVLGVLGCMAQRLGEQIRKRFGFVRLVCGTREFLNVPDYLRRLAEGESAVVALDDEKPVSYCRNPCARPQKHHAYVAIMRGCNRFCSYCIVPYVRGREVSRDPGEIVEEVRRLCDDGVQEITLLGQNVNTYGRGLSAPGASLPALLELLNCISGLRRIRFLTNHPADMTPDILHAVGDLDKVCEHMHMPAQSGSDRILKAMNRGYTCKQYRDLVEMARDIVPGIEIASDFIVGFPGERDEDFAQTLALLQDIGFQQSFIFKYSPRPGTRGEKLQDDVPDATKSERHRVLLAAQQEHDLRRRKAMIGRTVEVLVEGTSKGDSRKLTGRTRQNDIVVFEGPQHLCGELCRVEVVNATALTLFACGPSLV